MVTRLSKRYGISRTFIYQLCNDLKSHVLPIFEEPVNELTKQAHLQSSLEAMLLFRLEGGCSINNISSLLKYYNYGNSSVGMISQNLSLVGGALTSTIKDVSSISSPISLHFTPDEVYMKSHPILVVVDPVSTAILSMQLSGDRSADSWTKVCQDLAQSGVEPLSFVKDEAKGMDKAFREFYPETPRATDNFHGLAYNLGVWKHKFYKSWQRKVNKRKERERVFDSARTEAVISNRLESYETALAQEELGFYLYDGFCFVYLEMIKSLELFSPNGQANTALEAQATIQAGIDLLLEQTVMPKDLKEELLKLAKRLPKLLGYFEFAQKVCEQLKPQCPTIEAFELLCAAYQAHKNQIKAKNAERTKQYQLLEQDKLKQVQQHMQPEAFEQLKGLVYQTLDTIILSSSIVETINSIVRPYLNMAKNQLNQPMLNLIMFYHNHRVYKAGKRKGYSPMELLTGKKQQHWLEALAQQVAKDVSKLDAS